MMSLRGGARAEDVALGGDGHQADAAVIHDVDEVIEAELSAIVDIDPLHLDPDFFFELQPRDDIAVVLKDGKENHVVLVEIVPPPRFRDEVDRLRATLGEDDLLRVGGVDECPDNLTRSFICDGRTLGEHVHAPVHVRILFRIELLHPIQDGLGFLRSRCGIEVDQRMALNLLIQERKLPADGVEVEYGRMKCTA